MNFNKKHTYKKRLLWAMAILVATYLLLLIPDTQNTHITKPATKAFAWNKDNVWQQLETRFTQAKAADKLQVDSAIMMMLTAEETFYQNIAKQQITPTNINLDGLLSNFFSLSALVAAQPAQRDSFINLYSKVRNEIKRQSQQWDMNNVEVRNSMYRVLYGMRTAVEEVLLQTGSIAYPPAMPVHNEPSATPATNILGIEVHSGDLLVSRGGAAVSALIARGNDYPGNFSHVALIYINEKNEPYLIEAHIEKGVAVSSVADYIKDKKLRFMVLRPRADLPQIKANPQLPQLAASFAYRQAMAKHIPYDFKMNFYDSSALFCSEVGSYAYRKNGIQLWQGVSTISSAGVINWLHNFGVENFVTQMPADLEYDPQLSVVAEWRNPETLLKDHIDNAVIDALLERADKGETIGYNIWMLPVIRVVKGWCMLQNLFGKPGIIPEGMTATQALKNQTFVARYNQVQAFTTIRITQFEKEHGYRPPYWQIIKLAEAAAVE